MAKIATAEAEKIVRNADAELAFLLDRRVRARGKRRVKLDAAIEAVRARIAGVYANPTYWH